MLVPGGGQVRDAPDVSPVERIGEVRGVEPRVGQGARVRIVNRILADLRERMRGGIGNKRCA